MNEHRSSERLRDPARIDAPVKPCIGCREPIQAAARICPHCGTAQRRSRWGALGRALRWTGGVVAVLGLVFAAWQLAGLHESWRERQAVLADMVAAAELQAEVGDYHGAWRLLEDALREEAGLAAARRLRTRVAMAWVRELAPSRAQSVSDTVERLLPALHLGTVQDDPAARADVLAHVGWANHLRSLDAAQRPEIEGYYRRAIAADPDNVFAHVMWGHWLLWPGNAQAVAAQRVPQAFEHFEAALAAGRSRPEVRAFQLRGLLNYRGDLRARLAAVVVANEVRIEGGALEPTTAESLLGVLRDTATAADPNDTAFKRRLDSEIPAAELLATYRWMLRALAQSPSPIDLLALGELAERSGYDQRALAFYHESFAKAADVRLVRSRAAAAIERLTGASANETP